MISARDRNLALLVAGCFFMENLDATIVTTAAPRIAAALHVPSTATSMVITAYVLTLAVLIPISGWMSGRFGARPVGHPSASVPYTFAFSVLALIARIPTLGALRPHGHSECAPRALIFERELLTRLRGVPDALPRVVALESLGDHSCGRAALQHLATSAHPAPSDDVSAPWMARRAGGPRLSRFGLTFAAASAGNVTLEPEFAHVDGNAGARRFGRVHRTEFLGSFAHVLGGVEQLQHDRCSLGFVE
jgi:hypothetical protein